MRILILLAVVCVCAASVSAQTRADAGLRIGGSSDLSYEGMQASIRVFASAGLD